MIDKDIDTACSAYVELQAMTIHKDIGDICTMLHLEEEYCDLAVKACVNWQRVAFMVGACWADRLWRTGTEEELTALRGKVDEYIKTMIETRGIIQ